MESDWLDARGLFLTHSSPLPLDAPFTTAQAAALGVSRHHLAQLVEQSLVRRVLRGVYIVMQAPDTMNIRAAALALIVPTSAVVTDRTAAWLHGVDLLPRSALFRVPPVNVAHTDDTRVRREHVDGMRRGLLPRDITVLEGVRVTTPLRTAMDLGRLLWRYDALAAIDGYLRIGVPQAQMEEELHRYKGYRGVIQLRHLVPLGDPRSESVGESGLRLHWHEAGLPRPELQCWVNDDNGVGIYRIDLALPELLHGAEYDGDEFHNSEEDREADAGRRKWLADKRGWSIDVFDKRHLYERVKDPKPTLLSGFRAARRRAGRWRPRREPGSPRRSV